MHYNHIEVTAEGEMMTVYGDHSINARNNRAIPCTEGDGISIDAAPVMMGAVNPAVPLLSCETMFSYADRTEAADLIEEGVANKMADKALTIDPARLRESI